MHKKLAAALAIVSFAAIPTISPAAAAHAYADAPTAILTRTSGSGCTAKEVTGKGNFTSWTGMTWTWVTLKCGQIRGAKQARAHIICNYAPDRYTSWLESGESGESGGCPFSVGGIRIEYR